MMITMMTATVMVMVTSKANAEGNVDRDGGTIVKPISDFVAPSEGYANYPSPSIASNIDIVRVLLDQGFRVLDVARNRGFETNC